MSDYHTQRRAKRHSLRLAALLAAGLLTACGRSDSLTDSAPESSLSEQTSAVSETTTVITDGTTTADASSADRPESSRADETAKQTEGSSSDSTTASADESSSAQTTGSTASGNGTTATTATTAKTDSGTKSTASSKTTATTAPGPKKDPGFGAKWSDLFTTGGAPVVKSDAFPYSYKSEDVNVQLTKQKYGESEYFVADIHVRYIDNLKSAFSINRATGEEEYGAEGGANYQEDGAVLSKRVNSIVTINGDYYSGRKNGIIFRNGTLYRNIPRAEIGAVYRDGTYKGFAKEDFDVTAEQNKGLWQVMGFEPRLVENGKAISNITEHLYGDAGYKERMAVAAPRSGFGYYEPGHYCFVVADGRRSDSVGPELEEWANFFESLGCDGAFNLDGGASSQMYFMGELVNQPTTGTSGGVVRQLPDVFYIGEVG